MDLSTVSVKELEDELDKRTRPQRFTLVLSGFNKGKLMDQMKTQDIALSDEAWQRASYFFDEIEVEFEVDYLGSVWQL